MATKKQGKLISKSRKSQTTGSKHASERMDFIQYVMAGVIVVLFIGFATLFVTVYNMYLDSSQFESSVYQNYADKINALNQLLRSNQQLMKENQVLLNKPTPTPTP